MPLYLDLVYQWEEGQVGQKYGDETAAGGQASSQDLTMEKFSLCELRRTTFFITVPRFC
jgi:hypothetical protein